MQSEPFKPLKGAETQEYIVTAKVKFNGAVAYVDATSPEHAKSIVERSPDFHLDFAELVDWEITGAELNK